MKIVMKKNTKYIIVYFLILFGVGMIATHNEYLETSLCITLFFSVPLTLIYSLILHRMDKKNNSAWKITLAVINTIFFGVILIAVGIYLIEKYIYIPF